MVKHDCPHCGQDMRLPPDAAQRLKECETAYHGVGNTNQVLKKQLAAYREDFRIQQDEIVRLHRSREIREEKVQFLRDRLHNVNGRLAEAQTDLNIVRSRLKESEAYNAKDVNENVAYRLFGMSITEASTLKERLASVTKAKDIIATHNGLLRERLEWVKLKQRGAREKIKELEGQVKKSEDFAIANATENYRLFGMSISEARDLQERVTRAEIDRSRLLALFGDYDFHPTVEQATKMWNAQRERLKLAEDVAQIALNLDAECDFGKFVCYASTPDEYWPNRLVRDIRVAFHKWKLAPKETKSK